MFAIRHNATTHRNARVFGISKRHIRPACSVLKIAESRRLPRLWRCGVLNWREIARESILERRPVLAFWGPAIVKPDRTGNDLERLKEPGEACLGKRLAAVDLWPGAIVERDQMSGEIIA